ncbi:MAG: sigma-54 interaction domain-containing protein [Chitinivibrionales bacterium]
MEPIDTILESISDGVFTVDLDWRISSFNRAAEEITGISREEAAGRYCYEVFRSSMCESECALRHTLDTGRPVIDKSGYIITAQGRRIPVSVSTAVLYDRDGEIIGGAETFRDLSEVEALRKELEGHYRVGDLVSRSRSMDRIFNMIPAVAESMSTVLIQGETGTGKEVLAKALHSSGPRSEEPFIAVNCGALPPNLLESELFGYRKGAFTGADKDKQGRFSAAGSGTLFLDEIGEVRPDIQVKLLRVLQDGVYEPLGASGSEQSNARIITATNKDLGELVKQGGFRKDLYYRINIIQMKLPPLRERKEDIPLLVNHFISKFNIRQGRNIKGIDAKALSILSAHTWPGNIRELENVIERAFVVCSGTWITPKHLDDELTGGDTNESFIPAKALRAAVDDVEREFITGSLERNGYNRTATARELGLHKTTLYRKIKALNIDLPLSPRQSGV